MRGPRAAAGAGEAGERTRRGAPGAAARPGGGGRACAAVRRGSPRPAGIGGVPDVPGDGAECPILGDRPVIGGGRRAAPCARGDPRLRRLLRRRPGGVGAALARDGRSGRRPRRRRGRPTVLPSYRGLTRYEPDDAALFFGRDRLVDRLTALTRRHRFTAVFGPSGSGKSSLLGPSTISLVPDRARWT
ncbi:hypothetical protein ACFWPV_16655 [Streptomyces uncialis]|uniref:nSTAND1 domain-containing NTPase n=1 Tax=Streptomyces uncialis TaxID=1048205 RepID=UPI003656D4B2